MTLMRKYLEKIGWDLTYWLRNNIFIFGFSLKKIIFVY
jgi:hypothetical protein